jgi:alkylmercury lyase
MLLSPGQTACGGRCSSFLLDRASRRTCTKLEKRPASPQKDLRTAVAELEAYDLLGSDPGASVIPYAYPFTGQETEHRVGLCGRTLHAVCAVDALGIAGMFRTDIVIESSCRACGGSIEVGTAEGGKSLSHARPVDAVVWYDLVYSGCAASSCCRSIAFFCSKAELQHWLTAQSQQPIGYRLTLDEALEVGRAIFEPVLALAPDTQ